jgi:hypothetical protein
MLSSVIVEFLMAKLITVLNSGRLFVKIMGLILIMELL